MNNNNWEEEFQQIFKSHHEDEYSFYVFVAFIRDLIIRERETAVKEFCQKLNDQGLGEDEGFKRFCEEWGKVFGPVV